MYDILRDGNQHSFHGDMWFQNGLVVVGTDVETGHIYAFERDTGRLRWKLFAGRGVSTDIVGGSGRVYAVTLEDRLLSLKLNSGQRVWSYHSERSSPDTLNRLSAALADSLVLYADNRGELFAIRTTTGARAWSRAFESPVVSSITVANGAGYFSTGDGTLHRVDAASGLPKSELSLGGTAHRVSCERQGVFAIVESDSMPGLLVAADDTLGRIRWQQQAYPGLGWSTDRITQWKETVLAGNPQGEVLAFDIDDGSPAWSLRVEGVVKSLSSDAGFLYVGVQEGRVYAFQERGSE